VILARAVRNTIKLIGIKFEAKTYIVIQLTLISCILCTATAYCFFVNGSVKRLEASKVGLFAFVFVFLRLESSSIL